MSDQLRATACFLLIVVSSVALAQEEDEDLFAPGLIGKYSNAKGVSFTRRDLAISFAWKDGIVDRRLPAGPFRAEWNGFLLSQANGSYRLHAFLSGKLRLTLGDKVLIDKASDAPEWHSSPPIELDYDYHPLRIEYQKTNEQARLALFWNGPQFQLEPIDGRQLFHQRGDTPSAIFERGESLVRAFRCEACHQIGSGDAKGEKHLAAPSLEHLSGNLDRDWLVRWLIAKPELKSINPSFHPSRRMPHFALEAEQAEDIAAWLFANSTPVKTTPPPKKSDSTPSKAKSKKKKDEPEPPVKTPLESGRELFLTVGCLACHQLGEKGEGGLYDGGDLSAIAAKRPPKFFETWLASPDAINSRHRMPIFELTEVERQHLVAFLVTLTGQSRQPTSTSQQASVERGAKAIATLRCTACHVLPDIATMPSAKKTPLDSNADWQNSCIGNPSKPGQPRFSLNNSDRDALRMYASQVVSGQPAIPPSAQQLLAENNCLSCHQRNEAPGLAPRLTAIAGLHADLAAQIPSMTPPPLNSVGDKLHDNALRGAISRQGTNHRPYLLVRMPRFRLEETELQTLLNHFVSTDRIPPGLRTLASDRVSVESALLEAVGSRLVTPDGFGCTSCHQLGQVMPVKAPLNARGPDLSMLGQRVRREWYDRWVRNPSRIVPRMEMPSVQIAVRGVLHDNLDDQLAAVWDVLNRQGFQPPQPNPIRVVRHSGTQPDSAAKVVTDVLRSSTQTYVKPILVGLSNRHNILFDLETARLIDWSIGDTARQRTEGKSWFWETAGKQILQTELDGSEITLQDGAAEETPRASGQFVTEFDELEHPGNGLKFRYRLDVGGSSHRLLVSQTFTPWVESGRSGFRRVIELSQMPANSRVRLAVLSKKASSRGKLSADSRTITIQDPAPVTLSLVQPASAVLDANGNTSAAEANGTLKFELVYSTPLTVDQFVIDTPISPQNLKPEALQVVPGFSAQRLALTDEIMPTAITWRPNRTLVIASLKGHVWQAHDTDGDGLADRLVPLCDELAAPYGLSATDEYVDVANKYALIRLFDDDSDGRADRMVTIASGWGHTADYHDWAVGLPRDEKGNYYMALPCQQDERSAAAARYRGEFLKLVPRPPSPDNPQQFELQTISRGHRFPMGIARRRDGELFVSDNQGNYNPFNEINHVQANAHFGFVNAIDKGSNDRPPLTTPAINLPHPWTRSVNGICFLETPADLWKKTQRDAFGPFEGHLIGCEYDTRRLIRMSFQKVGDVFQGAAYPFSYDHPTEGPPLLGPLVCEVSPSGDLYVGGIRDSGWGGANNVGEVVRLQFRPDTLPCGIAEMRSVQDGFEIDFTAEVDASLASDIDNYSLASYTRESTPAYGGPDLDHRTEQLKAVTVSPDRRRVTLHLTEQRIGYVYELHVKKLVADDGKFFPAEAHFTLRAVGR